MIFHYHPIFGLNYYTYENEIVNYQNEDNSTSYFNSMQEYINSIQEDNGRLQGLILRWREKIEEDVKKLIIDLDKIKNGTSWTDPIEVEELLKIIEKYKKPLREFDTHFNITSERYGSTEK